MENIEFVLELHAAELRRIILRSILSGKDELDEYEIPPAHVRAFARTFPGAVADYSGAYRPFVAAHAAMKAAVFRLARARLAREVEEC